MFVMTFCDTINCSFSNKHVSQNTEVVKVSDSVDKLKQIIEDVKWELNEESGNWFGYCLYDGEVEREQYFQITKVDVI